MRKPPAPNQVQLLTPQMAVYDEFDDPAHRNYQPYLMYFHRTDFRSPVVNTDRLGFRLSHGSAAVASVAHRRPTGRVNLVAGASIGFGIGAGRDEATIPSRLWSRYAPSTPWLNFGAVRYNPAQEVLLYLLHRHLLPELGEVLVFSGFNALHLARLPARQQNEHGAFYLCGEYYEQMDALRARHVGRFGFGRRRPRTAPAGPAVPPGSPGPTGPGADAEEEPPTLARTIATAVDLTARHLASWQQLLAGTGARLTYVLHPPATWLREQPAPQERLLFADQDRTSRRGSWDARYGALSSMETGASFSAAMRRACARIRVDFLDLTPLLRAEATEHDWLYIDRGHMTDRGYDLTSRVVADELGLR
ncbi:hypothetical protein BX285_4287 [Streptomyces sp. 1114.5]|uniref:Inducer of phenazine A n=1 Tax=Streptomyces sp. 1114.5 TaxID=1938830 RepID=UPI000F2C3531|nr:Inducer of phenazine A [Streptomyces sp. 1114.5]RKT19817.1 hypothetical protein BX285_4287 [Streptomyces sp. 1114.5]